MKKVLDYVTIMNKCKNKIDMACYNDRHFYSDKDKYVWVLGYDVIECLIYALTLGTVSPTFTSPEKDVYKLMDINIHIDTENVNAIRLFKEVQEDY